MSSRIIPEISKQYLQSGSITNNTSSNPETSFANVLGSMQKQRLKNSSLAAMRDLTHITPVEFQKTINQLLRSGHINFDESTSLSGFMNVSPLSKLNYDGLPPGID